MSKILISWIATENDFTKGKLPINQDGPNCTVHKNFYIYDKHILLSSYKNTRDDVKYQHLVTHLRNTFCHIVEEKTMAINDVIDLVEISAKVNTLLLSYRNDEIDIFISTGTPTMQVAWYFAHQSLGIKTRLFQLRKAEHSLKKVPEQIWINLEKSSYTSSIIIKQHEQDRVREYGEIKILGSLKNIYEKARKIAGYDHIRVLITGETGTGKELLARYIHKNSPRKNAGFEAINCSALGDELIESRLFGYVKGAFTGAIETRNGLFQELDGGTIFLDEIGDITPYMQQSLLRVIQSGEVLKVGSRKTEKVNVRVISATNKNLVDLCFHGKFRVDLYYRLAVSENHLPSLKEYKYKEKEDIFDFLWNKSKSKFNKEEPRLTKEIKKRILEYIFPGNIREMENMIDGIIAEADKEVKLDHLPERLLQPRIELSLKLEDVIRNHIEKVYEICNRNISRTAKILGVSQNTVRSKLGSLRIGT